MYRGLPKHIYYSYALQVFWIVLGAVNPIICSRVFAEEGYYPGGMYYDGQQAEEKQYEKVNAALELLEHAPEWVPDWPDPSVKLGQVSGVTLDAAGRVLVFHRATNSWGADTFSSRNVYQNIGEPPIPHATVMVFNDTGELMDTWGQNLFYMPHGIASGLNGDVWLTDVALHQVFKFSARDRLKPALTLGEKFVPGDDEEHFCKPSSVAVLATGEFFVADGYCNSRIIKYAPDGTKILQWGREGAGESPFALSVPHALALAEDRGALCVADRERGRASCFRTDNGTHLATYRSWLIGGRLFSIAYSPAQGGRLYVVNGAGGGAPVRGYVIEYGSGTLVGTFSPPRLLSTPHDLAVSADARQLYVAELDPHRLHKFVAAVAAPAAPTAAPTAPAAKPTATAEGSMETEVTAEGAVGAEGPRWWWGAAGGAGGAAAGALTLAALVALLRARAQGGLRRRWEYGGGEFKLRRLLERRRFTRVDTDDSEDERAGPMLTAAA